MQIVYISKRPQTLLATLELVGLFQPYIKSAVACVPDALNRDFHELSAPIPIEVVTESCVMSNTEVKSLCKLDHQSRNYLIRRRLVENHPLEHCFIMSDDDARPLKPVPLDRYIENDKYHRYFFYDLQKWRNSQTDFDAGQQATYAVLQYNGVATLSYASHMPQIIDRELYLECTDYFDQYSHEFPICEWTSYFNKAAESHPERFHPARPYLTLCWPEHPLAWKLHVEPTEFLFENFSASLYKRGQPFSEYSCESICPKAIAESNIAKIAAWQKHSVLSFNPEQRPGVAKYFMPRTWMNKLIRYLE